MIDRQLEVAASGHSIEVLRGTGERIVRLFRRFQPYAAFPGPASGFARELVTSRARTGEKDVGPDAVVNRFRDRTGLPELFLSDELPLERGDVREWFREPRDRPARRVRRCRGHGDDREGRAERSEAAARACSFSAAPPAWARRSWRRASRSISSATARAPKKPGESPRLLRFDMCEFGGFDAVDRLLGSSNGEPGELIRRVRQQPFCVLLLDEIEKAADPVFDALMGVLDEGRLTDPYGRETNFRSAIVLMTSNLGARRTAAVGFDADTRATDYTDAAMKFFRPEFFNRMDAVVAFDPLRPASVTAIARRELDAVLEREGLASRGLRVQWSEPLVAHIAAAGFDARYGARPLQRVIERLVVAEFAKWLLQNPAVKDRTLHADWTESGLVLATT